MKVTVKSSVKTGTTGESKGWTYREKSDLQADIERLIEGLQLKMLDSRTQCPEA